MTLLFVVPVVAAAFDFFLCASLCPGIHGSVTSKGVAEGVFSEASVQKKKHGQISHVSREEITVIKAHVGGRVSVHQCVVGVLLCCSWCFVGVGSPCHSHDNRVLSTQAEEC